jgi:hypothetical protein
MSSSKNAVQVRIGKREGAAGPQQNYLVTVYKALKSGDLFALVLNVQVSAPIEWVRRHVDEIVTVGIQQDSIAKLPQLPIVALSVELAPSP